MGVNELEICYECIEKYSPTKEIGEFISYFKKRVTPLVAQAEYAGHKADYYGRLIDEFDKLKQCKSLYLECGKIKPNCDDDCAAEHLKAVYGERGIEDYREGISLIYKEIEKTLEK